MSEIADNPQGTPPAYRNRPLGALALLVGGLGSAYLGWLLVGLWDWRAGPLDTDALGAINAVAIEYWKIFIAAPLALTALAWLQPLRLPRLPFLTDLVIALLTFNSARRIAQDLRFGAVDASSGSGAPIVVLVMLLFVALWRWHRLGCGPHKAEGWFDRNRATWLPLWALSGLIALYALRAGALAYLPLNPRTASYFVFPAWVIAGSLIFALARLHFAIGWGLGFVTIGAVFATRPDPAALAQQSYEAAPLNRLAQAAIDPQSPPSPVHLDFSEPSRFQCKTPGTREYTTEVPVPPEQRRNVILISVDSLRERETKENYKRGHLMPKVKGFGKKAKVFENAFTTYPAALPALGSAMTGWFPSELYLAPALPDNLFALTREAVDVQQIVFPGLGWFTHQSVEDLLVQDTPVSRLKGVSKQVNYLLGRLNFLRKKNKSLLAWVHVDEPRRPYQQRPGFKWGKKLRNRYRSEVAYTDSQLGRLLDELEDGGWFEDSLIIIFGAHGEAQGERGYYGHHVYLNGWTIDIPLIVHYPRVEASKVPDFVQITDILPTVLHWLGEPIPDDVQGRSLFETLERPLRRMAVSEAVAVRGRDIYDDFGVRVDDFESLEARTLELSLEGKKEYAPKVSIVHKNDRLIAERNSGDFKLYQRGTDVHEKRDRSEKEPERLVELLEALRDWHFETSQRIYCRVLATQR